MEEERKSNARHSRTTYISSWRETIFSNSLSNVIAILTYLELARLLHCIILNKLCLSDAALSRYQYRQLSVECAKCIDWFEIKWLMNSTKTLKIFTAQRVLDLISSQQLWNYLNAFKSKGLMSSDQYLLINPISQSRTR